MTTGIFQVGAFRFPKGFASFVGSVLQAAPTVSFLVFDAEDSESQKEMEKWEEGPFEPSIFLNVVMKIGGVFLNLVKTEHAVSQLSGSLEPEMDEDCKLIFATLKKIREFVKMHAEKCLDELIVQFKEFWMNPLLDVSMYKAFDMLIGVFVQSEAGRRMFCNLFFSPIISRKEMVPFCFFVECLVDIPTFEK